MTVVTVRSAHLGTYGALDCSLWRVDKLDRQDQASDGPTASIDLAWSVGAPTGLRITNAVVGGEVASVDITRL